MPSEYTNDLAITEGGAEATAYASLQFEGVDELKRLMLREELLLFCELDTLAAIVMIV